MAEEMSIDEMVACLRSDVEDRYGHALRVAGDFIRLSEVIEEQQHEHVSPTTLKRMWGYIDEPVTPRMSTLDILAQFVGQPNFAAYCEQLPEQQPAAEQPARTPKRHRAGMIAGACLAAVAVVAAVVVPTLAHRARTAGSMPGVAADKVIKRGDHFNTCDDYLQLFGINTQDCERYQTVPGMKAVSVWSPVYQHPIWHNEVDTTKGCTSIREYWTPDPQTRKPYMTHQYVTLFNKYRLYHNLNENAVRITFMKDYKGRPGFTFLGIYRFDPQRSTEQCVVFELVDTTCVLADLAKFRGYAARINR